MAVRWHVIATTGNLSSWEDAPPKRTVHQTYDGALLQVDRYNRTRRYATVILIKGDSREDR